MSYTELQMQGFNFKAYGLEALKGPTDKIVWAAAAD